MSTHKHLQHGPIDVHAHMVPHDFPANTANEARWPCMERRSPIDATVMIAGKPFRQLDDRSWDVKRRIEDMDRDGVAAQALSPMPELLSYWFDRAGAELFCDYVNEDIAEQVKLAPNRFVGLGSVPMQFPDLAVKHLRRVHEVYGLSGIEIGSNINGAMLGDAKFDPIYEAAADLGLAIFVHALHPVAMKNVEFPQMYVNTLGFPIDNAMAVASLLAAGTLEKHPKLRLGFSHGGGAIAPILHRITAGWRIPLNNNLGSGGDARSPADEQAAKMFFDSNVYEPAYLAYLTKKLSPNRIMLGTDYPYAIMQLDPVAYVKKAGFDQKTYDSLMWGAAHEFLNASSK
ncbi:MAG: amidohydrolase family protein [Hyphomonadaceae bacterium]